MTQRSDNLNKLRLYDELTDIVGAMRNLAQVELHRVNRAAAVQQQACDTTVNALNYLPVKSSQATARSTLLLVLGSERGFCGGFNEQILREYQRHSAHANFDHIVFVGDRLINKLSQRVLNTPSVKTFSGASTVDEVFFRVNSVFEQLVIFNDFDSWQLLVHQASGVQLAKILPVADNRTIRPIVQLTVEPTILRKNLQRQCLLQRLIHFYFQSLLIENKMRLQQMEGAKKHLEELSANLMLKLNAMRQEQIIEEIEVITGDQLSF